MKMKTAAYTDKMILVRGGGDLATGVIHKLHQSGYQVLILECDRPSAIRRHVAKGLRLSEHSFAQSTGR